jgi:hypothetical protein
MTTIRRYIAQLNRGAQAILATLALALIAAFLAAMLYSFFTYQDDDQPAGVMTSGEMQKLCGWSGEDLARKEGARLAKQFIPFLISENGEPFQTEDRRSVLWDAAKKVLGRHIPTKKQEIGDCVSFGAASACEYLLAVQIAAGSQQEWHEVFPPWIYGGSRVVVGKGRLGCRSDGSVGAWAAAWLLESGGGALPADSPGVPRYSGSIAKDWGCKGPPKQFAEFAKPNFLRAAANVTTWQECRDALINGYPVTIASNVGFEGRGVEREGKMFRSPNGNWGHQMFLAGYDLRPEPCFYILNSWGPAWCEAPTDDAPPGGFWVTAKTIQRIVSQGDSYAFSDAQGFPARQWDIILDGPPTGENRNGSINHSGGHPRRTAAALPDVRNHYALAP